MAHSEQIDAPDFSAQPAIPLAQRQSLEAKIQLMDKDMKLLLAKDGLINLLSSSPLPDPSGHVEVTRRGFTELSRPSRP